MALYNKINKEELKQQIKESPTRRITLSFYKYHQISDPLKFRDHLFRAFSNIDVLGRIYVAREGINAQISVSEPNLETLKNILAETIFLKNIRLNIAIEDDGKSFYVLKIKVREKIVADGLTDDKLDLSQGGMHINAETFNVLAEKDDTLIVDMRNHYESEVGHFRKAICPDVETFRESLSKVDNLLRGNEEKNIVMYCTGGIRCEKATAFFKQKGFKNLYQLDGGIIEYARQVRKLGLPNKFVGKNFVFDERLGERISEEVIARCHQCGAPCDDHKNCSNDACHLLFIQCNSCADIFRNCCSTRCAEFNSLPESQRSERKREIIFNGTKFGKGRYKAHHHGDLDLS